MPQIIPIKDLKNTSEISELCHSAGEPVFITRNGYGDMVLMSMETYERTMMQIKVYEDLAVSAQQAHAGQTKDAQESLDTLKVKYGL